MEVKRDVHQARPDAAQQIEQQVLQMPELCLHVIPKDPEEQHIA